MATKSVDAIYDFFFVALFLAVDFVAAFFVARFLPAGFAVAFFFIFLAGLAVGPGGCAIAITA